MSDPVPSVSEDEFAGMVRRAGLGLDAGSCGELYGVYGHLERMLARNRLTVEGVPRARGAEPATIFQADRAWRVS